MPEEGGNSDRIYNEAAVHTEGFCSIKMIVNLITSFSLRLWCFHRFLRFSSGLLNISDDGCLPGERCH